MCVLLVSGRWRLRFLVFASVALLLDVDDAEDEDDQDPSKKEGQKMGPQKGASNESFIPNKFFTFTSTPT